jgi:hypothetical protein
MLCEVPQQVFQKNKCSLIRNPLGVSVKLKMVIQSEVKDSFNKFQQRIKSCCYKYSYVKGIHLGVRGSGVG